MYYFIFEDGSVGKSELPPTEFDMQCIEDGLLEVLDTTTHEIITAKGRIPIPTLEQVVMPGIGLIYTDVPTDAEEKTQEINPET